MRVRMEPASSVKPHPCNPRRGHDVQGIARSIRAFGFASRSWFMTATGSSCRPRPPPRGAAARPRQGPRPPRCRGELTPEQAVAYRLADNRSAEGCEWDEALLLSELALLDERARQEAGFEDAYIAELKRRQELENLVIDPAEDEVPEPPAQPVSRRGDLWLLGDHKLLCGDATSTEDVARLGDHGHLMVTDPPYGVEYEPAWRKR